MQDYEIESALINLRSQFTALLEAPTEAYVRAGCVSTLQELSRLETIVSNCPAPTRSGLESTLMEVHTVAMLAKLKHM